MVAPQDWLLGPMVPSDASIPRTARVDIGNLLEGLSLVQGLGLVVNALQVVADHVLAPGLVDLLVLLLVLHLAQRSCRIRIELVPLSSAHLLVDLAERHPDGNMVHVPLEGTRQGRRILGRGKWQLEASLPLKLPAHCLRLHQELLVDALPLRRRPIGECSLEGPCIDVPAFPILGGSYVWSDSVVADVLDGEAVAELGRPDDPFQKLLLPQIVGIHELPIGQPLQFVAPIALLGVPHVLALMVECVYLWHFVVFGVGGVGARAYSHVDHGCLAKEPHHRDPIVVIPRRPLRSIVRFLLAIARDDGLVVGALHLLDVLLGLLDAQPRIQLVVVVGALGVCGHIDPVVVGLLLLEPAGVRDGRLSDLRVDPLHLHPLLDLLRITHVVIVGIIGLAPELILAA